MTIGHAVEGFFGRLFYQARAGKDKLFHQIFTAPELLRVQSTAFNDGDQLPTPYLQCKGGQSLSPPLHWAPLPDNCQSVVLIIEDQDSPIMAFVHALAYFPLSREPQYLAEGALNHPTAAALIKLGYNSFGRLGYTGPRPLVNHGIHHYVFQLFALDIELTLTAPFKRSALSALMKDHVLAWGKLTGVCQQV